MQTFKKYIKSRQIFFFLQKFYFYNFLTKISWNGLSKNLAKPVHQKTFVTIFLVALLRKRSGSKSTSSGFLFCLFKVEKPPSFTRFSDPGLKGGELSENLSQFPTVQVCVEMGSNE